MKPLRFWLCRVALILPLFLGTARAAVRQPPDLSTPQTRYSAATLFNQGNAAARNGKIGPAVLNYERALLLSPNDPDIAANLHLVRAKAGLPETPENGTAKALRFAAPNTMSWLGAIGLVLGGTGVLLSRLGPCRRGVFRSLALAGGLLFVAGLYDATATWPRLNEAVILTPDAQARVSPAPAAEPAFALREGETVTVRAEHRDFVLVRTSTGRVGWLARSELAPVVLRSGAGLWAANRLWVSL
jgi:hypothetical protein